MPDEPTPPPHAILRTDRPVDPRRDAVPGSPGEQERHRFARIALLQLLLARPEVRDHYDRWIPIGPTGHISKIAIKMYDRIAQEAGLPGRAALWDPARPPLAPRFQALVDQMTDVWLEGMQALETQGRDAPYYAMTDHLAAQLATKLQIPRVWLSLELQWYFLVLLVSWLKDQSFTFRYEREAPDTTVRLRVDDSKAAFLQRARAEHERVLKTKTAPARASRLPKSAPYIRQYVAWLVAHRLDGVSIRGLARQYAATKPELAAGAQKQVRGGIKQATMWLNAVADVGRPERGHPQCLDRATGSEPEGTTGPASAAAEAEAPSVN